MRIPAAHEDAVVRATAHAKRLVRCTLNELSDELRYHVVSQGEFVWTPIGDQALIEMCRKIMDGDKNPLYRKRT